MCVRTYVNRGNLTLPSLPQQTITTTTPAPTEATTPAPTAQPTTESYHPVCDVTGLIVEDSTLKGQSAMIFNPRWCYTDPLTLIRGVKLMHVICIIGFTVIELCPHLVCD